MRRTNQFKSMILVLLLCFGLTSVWGQEITFFEFTGPYSVPPAEGWTSSGSVVEGGSYLKLSPGAVTSPLYASANNVVFKYDIASFQNGTNGTNTKLFILNSSDDVIAEYTLTSASSSVYITNQTVNVGYVATNFKIKIEGFGLGSGEYRGTRLQNYSLIGDIAPITPTLSTTSASISDLIYMEGNGPSPAKSFKLSGSNLDGTNVTLFVDETKFEISESENDNYTNEISLVNYDGSVKTIWGRLVTGQNIGNYDDIVLISGGGAEDISVNLSGEVIEYSDLVIFQKINSINDLTDGEYIIVSDSNAMNNIVSNSKLQKTSVVVSNNQIINPDANIIWKIETYNGNVKTIYNEEVGQYVSGGASNTNLTLNASASSDSQRWVTSIPSNNLFRFTNENQTSRAILYNGSVFGQYAISNIGNDYTELSLYKKIENSLSTIIWTIGNVWSNGTGPTSLDDNVIIEGDLTVSGNLLAKNMTVASSGSVTIPSGSSLKLAGQIVNNATAADFTVANGANLIQTSTYTGANIGDITVERNSRPMYRNDMTLWSSPVAGQSIKAFSPNTLNNRFWTYDEANLMYSVLPDVNALFEDGQGVAIRVEYDPNFGANETRVHEGKFIGVPFNGNITVPVVNTTSGFNLIGNPYASTIQSESFLTANPSIEAMYFWTHQYLVGSPNYNDNYAVFSKAGGTIDNIENIASAQGFIIKTNSSTDVLFNNDMRSADAAYFYRENETERNRIWISLSDQEQKIGQILLAYMTGATNEFDHQIDAEFLDGTSTGFYNLLDNEKYAIQGRALPFDNSDIVPLGFKITEAGTFTINLENVDGLFGEGNVHILLNDKKANTIHNLSQSAYTFAAEPGEYNDRFEIVYQTDGTMGSIDLTKNEVQVYTTQQNIVVDSKENKILSVSLFDLSGRIIHSNKHVNAKIYQIAKSAFSKQVLVVRIQTEKGDVITKKVINN